MQKIMSRVDEGVCLAIVQRQSDIDVEREDLLGGGELLQVSSKRIEAGKKYRPHEHLPVARATEGTQEAWIIISGRATAEIYDLDESLRTLVALSAGSCLVLLRGGHSLDVYADTIMYEVKNGPYRGQEADKRWLDE